MGLLLVLVAVGVFFDGLAGYVTARMAKTLEYWHVLAMLGLLVVIQYGVSAESSFPYIIHVLSLAGGIVAAFYGAYLAKRKRS